MIRKVKHARKLSKKQTASKGGVSRTKVRSIHPAMRVFKGVYPQAGAPYELALRTKASISFCEKVLDGRQQPGGPMLIALLQSDVGRNILIALMGDAKPTWWKGFRRSLELADLVRNQARNQADIEKMQREMAE